MKAKCAECGIQNSFSSGICLACGHRHRVSDTPRTDAAMERAAYRVEEDYGQRTEYDIGKLLEDMEALERELDAAEAKVSELQAEVAKAREELEAELRGEEAIRGALQILCNRYEQALRIIAGKQQCIDNLMSDKDVAHAALRGGKESV